MEVFIKCDMLVVIGYLWSAQCKFTDIFYQLAYFPFLHAMQSTELFTGELKVFDLEIVGAIRKHSTQSNKTPAK